MTKQTFDTAIAEWPNTVKALREADYTLSFEPYPDEGNGSTGVAVLFYNGVNDVEWSEGAELRAFLKGAQCIAVG